MVRKEGKFSDAICRKVLGSNSFASVGCLMMMTMNWFCVMVDYWKSLSLVCCQNHCWRFLPSQASDTTRVGFEFTRNRSPGFVDWIRAVLITVFWSRKEIRGRVNQHDKFKFQTCTSQERVTAEKCPGTKSNG